MVVSCPGATSTKVMAGSKREDARARDMRIFGGWGDEPELDELKKPMLDVVLGLFDGLDYDDGMC